EPGIEGPAPFVWQWPARTRARGVERLHMVMRSPATCGTALAPFPEPLATSAAELGAVLSRPAVQELLAVCERGQGAATADRPALEVAELEDLVDAAWFAAVVEA